MKGELRRGFKTECEALVKELRAEISLDVSDPLNPFELATFLHIDVLRLSQLQAISPEHVNFFGIQNQGLFSAVTLFTTSTRRTILHNDFHTDARQRSNVCHEIAHALLHHPQTEVLNDLGQRNHDPVIEAEANWLAGALLIPRPSALWATHRRMNLGDVARHFQVSEEMARYRTNVTGANKRK